MFLDTTMVMARTAVELAGLLAYRASVNTDVYLGLIGSQESDFVSCANIK